MKPIYSSMWTQEGGKRYWKSLSQPYWNSSKGILFDPAIPVFKNVPITWDVPVALDLGFAVIVCSFVYMENSIPT